MSVKQLSVFVENKTGSLCGILDVLSQNGIDLRSISVADTEDYGILRLLTTDSVRGEELLREAGFQALAKDVVAVEIPDRVGSLGTILHYLNDANINLEYMYSIINSSKESCQMVLRVNDNEKTEALLRSKGVKVLSDEQVKAG